MKILKQAKLTHEDFASCNEKATVMSNKFCEVQRVFNCNYSAPPRS